METRIPDRLERALADYAARLRGALGERLRAVRLFGSWARGEAGPGSDVDVWVLVDTLDPVTRRVPFDVSVETLLAHGVDVSPTLMDEALWADLRGRERRIAGDIEREGVAR